jgi:hypothetical protein
LSELRTLWEQVDSLPRLGIGEAASLGVSKVRRG